MTWIDRYQKLADAFPDRKQTPKDHFDEWLAREPLGDLRKKAARVGSVAISTQRESGVADAYILEMLFEIQAMLAVEKKSPAIKEAHGMFVRRLDCRTLFVSRNHVDIVVWCSYGRVYTIVDNKEDDPGPEDAHMISLAFAAIAEFLKAEAEVEAGS